MSKEDCKEGKTIIHPEHSEHRASLDPPATSDLAKLVLGERTGRFWRKKEPSRDRFKSGKLDVGKVPLKIPGRPSLKQKRDSEIQLGIEEGVQSRIMDSFKSNPGDLSFVK
eukprot:Gb_35062 [translate_table: standard]